MSPATIDYTRATEATAEVKAIIADVFEYHEWDDDQKRCGILVRQSLQKAVEIIIDNVPPSPDRTVALRKLREARMDCNSAITHKGKY